MKAHPGIEVVSANQYGGADVEGAYKKSGGAAQHATRSRTAALGVDGIFSPNESTTFAMLRVLQDNGWAGKVKFVGFDASRHAGEGAARRRHRRPRRAGSGQHGLPRREDDGRAPARAAGREADRHRRARSSRASNMDDARRSKELLQPDLSQMAEASDAAPRFEMRGVRKAFGATVALDGVDLAVARRRGLRAGRPERRRQEHADGDPRRARSRPTPATMTLDGAPYAPREPARGAPRRRRDDLPGALARAAPERDGEHRARRRADALRPASIARRMRADGAARAGAARARRHSARRRRRRRCRSAAQQLVEIARALAVGCRVLVLDEPTSSLGARRRARGCSTLIRRLKAQGHAIVYISHFIEEVKEIADRFVVLRDGRNAGGGVTRRRDARRDRRPDGRAAPSTICIRATPRRPASAIARGRRRSSRASATFTLHRGEILGIAGLLGAGRTRLLRAIFGLEPVTRGRVTRRRVRRARARARASAGAQGMGLLSEDRKGEGLALGLSVADNLTLTRLEPFGPRGAGAARRGRDARRGALDRRGWRSGARARAGGRASCRAATSRRSRSRGCSITTSTCCVLDEPTRGIDVGSKAQIYALIDELVADGQRHGREGGADGQQLPAGAARRLRSHRGDAPRPARRRRGRSPAWTSTRC